MTVDEAQRLEWELNLEPGRIISMVATEPIQVLLAHSDSEFATSFASDWYAD